MTPSLPLWVCAEPVDFRLGIDGLALKVQASLGPQRALNAAHVFFNRGRDKVKVLWYDRHRLVVDVQAPGTRSLFGGAQW